MSEIVATKKVVFKIEDLLSAPLAEISTKLSQMDAKLRAMGGGMESMANSQSGLRNSLSQTNTELGKTTSKLGKFKTSLSQLGSKKIAVNADTQQADEKLTRVQKYANRLTHQPKHINVTANVNQAERKLNEVKRRTRDLPDGRKITIKVKESGFTRLKGDLKSLGSSSNNLFKSLKEDKGIFRAIGAAGVASLGAVGVAMFSGTKKAMDLQNSLKTTSNILYTDGEKYRDSLRETNKMMADAKKYSIEYGQSQQDIADGYQELVKQGYDGKQAIGAMKSELQATVATGDDFKDVVKTSTNVLDDFGMRAKTTSGMVKNTKRVVNELAFAADKSATNFQEMGTAMEYVGSTAHEARVSLNDTSAAFGVLSNRGIHADKAGTGLRKMLQSLASPSASAKKALQQLGLTFQDFQTKSGNFKSLPKMFGLLNERMKGLGRVQKIDLLKKIFGTTGANAASVLSDNVNQLRELSKEIKKAGNGNYVATLAKRNATTAKMEMARAKQAIEAVSMTIGKSLLPAISSTGAAIAKNLSSKKTERKLNDLSQSMAKVGTSIGKYIGNHINDIIKLSTALAKISTTVATTAFKTMAFPFTALGKALSFITGGKVGSGLAATANSLDALAKCKPLIEGLTVALTSLFMISKLDKFANSLSNLGSGFKGLGNSIRSSKLYESISNLWKADKASTITAAKKGAEDGKAYTDAVNKETTAANAEQSIINETGGRSKKFASKHGGILGDLLNFGSKDSEVATIGKGIGGKLLGGIGIAFTGFDIAKTLFSKSKNSTKYKKVGSDIGSLVGAGIGMFFGGPFGAMLGAAVGGSIGKMGGKLAKHAVDGWNDYTNGHKPKTIMGKIAFNLHEAMHNWSKILASFGKRHPKINIAVQLLTRGFKAEVSLFKSKLKAIGDLGKNVGKVFSDLFMGRLKRIPKDIKGIFSTLSKDAKSAWQKAEDILHGRHTTSSSSSSSHRSSSHKTPTEKVPKFKAPVSKAQTVRMTGYLKEVEREISHLKSAISHANLGKLMTKQLNTLKNAVKHAKLEKSFDGLNKALKNLTKAFKKSNVAKQLQNSFKQISKVIKKSDLEKELKAISKAFQKAGKQWEELAKPAKSVSKSMSIIQKSIRQLTKKNGFEKLTKDFAKFDKTVRKSKFGKQLQQQLAMASKGLGGKKSFTKEFTSMMNSIIKSLKSFGKTFNKDWKNTWKQAAPLLRKGFRGVLSTFRRIMEELRSIERSTTNQFLHVWHSFIDRVVSSFREGLSKLPGIAASAMRKVISAINRGISGLNKVVSAFGGDAMKTASYATGTPNVAGTHPGGLMMVNDDGSADPREWIRFPNGKFMKPEGRNVTMYAPAGTTVFNSRQSKVIDEIVNRHVRHYANGTGDSDDAVQDYVDAHIDALAKNPLPLMEKEFFASAKFSGAEFVAKWGHALGETFLHSVLRPMKKLAEEYKAELEAPGAGKWLPVIKRAERILGVHLTQLQIQKMLRQIQTESGGNAKIKQQIRDINSETGNPAKGLLQFTQRTFDSWAIPGHTDIWNGLDQILAAINCLNHGGETGWAGFGEGHGWAEGGHITSKDLAWIGDNPEHDEYVINPHSANAIPLTNQLVTEVNRNHHLSQPSGGSQNEIVSLLRVAVDKLTNFDPHPLVNVDEMRQAINKRSAQQYALMKGQC